MGDPQVQSKMYSHSLLSHTALCLNLHTCSFTAATVKVWLLTGCRFTRRYSAHSCCSWIKPNLGFSYSHEVLSHLPTGIYLERGAPVPSPSLLNTSCGSTKIVILFRRSPYTTNHHNPVDHLRQWPTSYPVAMRIRPGLKPWRQITSKIPTCLCTHYPPHHLPTRNIATWLP